MTKQEAQKFLSQIAARLNEKQTTLKDICRDYGAFICPDEKGATFGSCEGGYICLIEQLFGIWHGVLV